MEAIQAQLASLQAHLEAQEGELAWHREQAEGHCRTIEACRNCE